MKKIFSIFIFVLGSVLGIGHATPPRIPVPAEMECHTFVTCIEGTGAVFQGKDKEGCPIFHCEKPIIAKCLNYPSPNFCEEGFKIIVVGKNIETGCAKYGCEKQINLDEQEKNELEILNEKLSGIYEAIEKLKQEAEKLRVLIAEKQVIISVEDTKINWWKSLLNYLKF